MNHIAAALAALGLLVLVAACASTEIRASGQATQETRGWERCDRSRPVDLTVLCFRR